MALLGGGGYAEYARVNAGHIMRIPERMDFKQAAAIPEVWLTAFQLIYWIADIRTHGKGAANMSYLVHAGASGVGTALVQILKKILKSEQIYVTVGNDEKIENLQRKFNLNKNHLINYKTRNFSEQVLTMTGNRGVDFIFDCVGGSNWQMNSECLGMGQYTAL
jgi:tumor protein p53-inducible protein 3